METTLIIKPVKNNYCRQVVELILPIQQGEFNIPVTLEDQPDLLDIETYYHGTGGGFWAAVENGELLGTIGLIATGHNAGAIRKMFVKKEFRGKEYGIGQQLLDIVIEYAKAAHITDLYLGTVEILKAAHRFYERNGFRRISRSGLPSYFPLMPKDNVFYHLNIT